MIVDQYFPPFAGALGILMKLKRRIDFPMDEIKMISHPLLYSERMENAIAKYEELSVSIVKIKFQIIKLKSQTIHIFFTL